MTKYDTFEHLNDWLNEAKKQIEHDAIFMLVGCKSDKEHIREVQTIDAQQFADYHNLLFIETSSKTGNNVEKAFNLIATEVYKRLEEGKFKGNFYPFFCFCLNIFQRDFSTRRLGWY
jgi:Ras-related protein Rab-39B